MIVLPEYQVPLTATLALLVFLHLRRRRLCSACLLAALLAYTLYLLAIDYADTVAQVRVFSHLQAGFVAANCAIIGTFATCFQLGQFAVTRAMSSLPAAPRQIARHSNAVLVPLVLGAALTAVSADGWWLLAPYPQNKGQFALIPLGGAGAVANLLLLIAVLRARTLHLHARLAMTVFWLTALHYVFAGDRGSLLFLTLGLYACRLQAQPRFNLRAALEMAVLGAGMLLLLDQISALRSWGNAARSSASFLEEIDLLPQSIAHMAHAIDVRLLGAEPLPGGLPAFALTLLIQIVPSGLLHFMGIETYNGPLLLSDYVTHGGGFLVPAELFFVGGLGTVAGIGAYFGAIAALNDRIAQRAAAQGDTLMTILVLLAAASTFYTMFYGVQALHRMLTLPIVFLAARTLLRTVLRGVPTLRAPGPGAVR